MIVDSALTFLDFVEARHEAFTNRQLGRPWPWSGDPIVNTRKFTNVFRVLDYGSQFVLTDLVDPQLDPMDQLMRLFLYRHTGRVEVWQHLELSLGRYPVRDDLDDVLEIFKEYRGGFREITCGSSTVGKPSRKGRISDRPLFTSAYLVFPQSQVPGTDKLESIIELTRRLFVTEPYAMESFVRPDTPPDRQFNYLRQHKGVANFMSMQILTDWGYTPHCGLDRENDFVIAGPGAEKGAKALGMKAPEAIRWARDSIAGLRIAVDEHFEFHRPPSLMDAQNCLCEFSKYVRYQAKPVPDKAYTPAHPGPQQIVLPEHW